MTVLHIFLNIKGWIADLYDDSINFDNFKDQDPESVTITEYTLTPEE